MIRCDHRFALLFQKEDGAVLGQLQLNPNWEPAFEWAAFAVQRAGRNDILAEARVTPFADERRGLPYATGFRMELTGATPPPPPSVFPVTFFSREARRISSSFVTAGKLRQGDTFHYRLLAFPLVAPPPSRESAPGFEVGEDVRPLAIREGALAPLIEASVAVNAEEGALSPVFIPEAVLEEIRELTLAAEAREVGGIVLGHLQRDVSLPEIGVVVTAQIPARHALGEADKLTFTAETWAAVEAAIALRRSDEIICGWWHSHPAKYWCAEKQCPASTRRNCSLQLGFFSADDVHLHESVFPKAFHVALVMTHADDGCRPTLFGWNQGAVQNRGYRCLTPGAKCSGPQPTIPSMNPELQSDLDGPSRGSKQPVGFGATGCPSEQSL